MQSNAKPGKDDKHLSANAPAPSTRGRRPKIGLALGAGVARGWAHIGVIRRLEEEGIILDVVAGTSIGAVVGGGFACGSLDEIETWARALGKRNFFRFLDVKLGGSGLLGSDKLNDLMRERFGSRRFDELSIPFTAVACELKSGHEVWLQKGSLSDSIRASFAMPGVFEPHKINSQWLVDGALVNPVPVSVCRAAGCDLVIAVNLSEDIYGSMRARREGALDTGDYGVFTEGGGEPVLANGDNKSLLRRLFGHKKDAPSMFTNLVASISIMQNRLARSRMAGDPPDVMISPHCGHVGLMEFHRAAELIEQGRSAFDASLAQLKDALAVTTHRINS